MATKPRPTVTGIDNPLPPKPEGTRWTDDQWAGIATTGRSVLVSAAAGSGKTAVLAERCAYLVCDAPNPCGVDEMLVVTFTEAAAAEMKARIERALHDRIGTTHDPRLRRQLALIDRAQVSTLHGFCARLIRQHFHLLELDPEFKVLDGDEAKLLRLEIARQLFAERHESPDAPGFHALVDAYADGNDERLIGTILKAHDLLASLVHPKQWLETARRRLAEPAEMDFRASSLGRELEMQIDAGIRSLGELCAQSLEAVSRMEGFDKYVADLHKCGAIIASWADALKHGGIDAVATLLEVPFDRLPSIPETTPGKKRAKELVDAVRDAIKKGPLRRMLSFTTAQWKDGLAIVRPHVEMFLDLVEYFGRRYDREKASLRTVDFSDLERLTLRALSNPSADGLAPSSVARMLHKQFAHVLVDEYQDINAVQDAILSLASRECVPEFKPQNLFCVGDVKQSIYRFRLAEPKRFLDRCDRFNAKDGSDNGTVIDLQANFRSRAPLLEALNGIFARLMTHDAAELDYDDSHKLCQGVSFPAGDSSSFTGTPIELHLLPKKLETDDSDDSHEPAEHSREEMDEAAMDRAEREAVLVARRINQLVGKDGSPARSVMERDENGLLKPRPIQYGDIVILLRSMKKKGEDYAEVLRRSGIPVHTDSGTGYFDSMEIGDMLALLKVLDNRAQDIPLAAVLRSPIASLPHAEDALARIRLAYPGKAIPFHQAVVLYAKEQDDELAAKLRDVLAQLDRWRLMAKRRPLAELIWDVYDSTGYLAFCTGLRDGEQRKANLIDLHDRARQFGSFQRQGLARFLSFLDSLSKEADLGQPSVVGEGENVVRIMTIHHSKGLEFPVVIVPDLGKKINLQDCNGPILMDRAAYLGMDVVDEPRQVRYPSLASMLVSNRIRRATMAEELRVLYVALTRAKEHLILIGTCKPDSADDWATRWSGHTGPLPTDAILGASSMLDWIGPAAVAMKQADSEPIEIITHSVEEVLDWPTPESLRPVEGKRQERLARLEPLDPKPPADTVADEIIARLAARYAFEAFTKLPAVEAATVLTKKGQFVPAMQNAPAAAILDVVRTLQFPRAIRTDQKPSPVNIGEATHLVLQHLDFTRPCDPADVREQVRLLADTRLIAPVAADLVDVESICWLMGTAVGKLLALNATSIMRELTLYLSMKPEEIDASARSDDPQDHVMVRCRLDALVRGERGLEIVDYKTDRVTKETLPSRVEFYRPQMELYRRAVELAAKETVKTVHLVFLSARHIQML